MPTVKMFKTQAEQEADLNTNAQMQGLASSRDQVMGDPNKKIPMTSNIKLPAKFQKMATKIRGAKDA